MDAANLDTDQIKNVKLVFETTADLPHLRETLVQKNIQMRGIESCPGFPNPSCDGKDPEGNVFQPVQTSPTK